MKIKLNSRQMGKNYQQFKAFMENIDKLKVGNIIGIVTKNKTTLLKLIENKK